MINVGDKVNYYGHEAIVIAIIPNSMPPQCKVEFLEKDLIPPKMTVNESELIPVIEIDPDYDYRAQDAFDAMDSLDEMDMFELEQEASDMYNMIDRARKTFDNERNKINVDEQCPKCRTPWTETEFGSKKWYDCVPCGKTKEAILSEKKS
jgi:hypothetical protein